MKVNRIVTFCIAIVWIVNGLFCKVLNLTPRHEHIIGTILIFGNARLLTVLIGLLEMCMAIWILSGFRSRLNAITQIIVIGSMNTLQFFLVPELLLWGRMNAIFALMFMGIIFLNEFRLKESPDLNYP
jgi:hypothetical protein